MARVAVEFQFGGEVESCTVTQWHVVVGERVRADQPLVELEVDKATVELGAPCDGIVEALECEAGDEVQAGAVLGWLNTDAQRREVSSARTTLGVCARGTCPRCGAAAAINTLAAAPACFECGATVEIEHEAWHDVVRAVLSGEDRIELRDNAWGLSVRACAEQPACHNCNSALDTNDAMGSIVCTACGTSHEQGPPPSWLAEAFPRLRALVGTLAPVIPTARATCDGCNTTMPAAVRVPIPRCPVCNRDVRPDVPKPVARRWYLISD